MVADARRHGVRVLGPDVNHSGADAVLEPAEDSANGRAVRLGLSSVRAVGEELAYLDQRVLFVGSGGLSHSPPSLVSTAAGLSHADAEQWLFSRFWLETA